MKFNIGLGVLFLTLAACKDEELPTETDDPEDTLTPEQGRVLRRHPLVYPAF